MRFFRRSLVALVVAAMLPTLVFAAVSVFYLLRAERERVTNATVEQSRIVMTLVDTQLQRKPFPLPKLAIKRRPPTLFDYRYDDFEIVDYQSHGTLKAPVAV